MGKELKNALLGIAIFAFLIVAGVFMNMSSNLPEKQEYPNDFGDIVQEKSKEYNVPISVIFAVMQAESNFDPDAESRVGARGLMQITKMAYEWIDSYRGETGASWEDLFTPEINIDYGVWLLSYLYEEFGEWETVYVAYNAGPTRVKGWLNDKNYSTDGITLYYIPYKETSNYREKVTSFREDYKSTYGYE